MDDDDDDEEDEKPEELPTKKVGMHFQRKLGGGQTPKFNPHSPCVHFYVPDNASLRDLVDGALVAAKKAVASNRFSLEDIGACTSNPCTFGAGFRSLLCLTAMCRFLVISQ